jgi:hypothetical protein
MPGMPMSGGGGRGTGFAFGMPRYGFKPAVIPKAIV